MGRVASWRRKWLKSCSITRNVNPSIPRGEPVAVNPRVINALTETVYSVLLGKMNPYRMSRQNFTGKDNMTLLFGFILLISLGLALKMGLDWMYRKMYGEDV